MLGTLVGSIFTWKIVAGVLLNTFLGVGLEGSQNHLGPFFPAMEVHRLEKPKLEHQPSNYLPTSLECPSQAWGKPITNPFTVERLRFKPMARLRVDSTPVTRTPRRCATSWHSPHPGRSGVEADSEGGVEGAHLLALMGSQKECHRSAGSNSRLVCSSWRGTFFWVGLKGKPKKESRRSN